MNISPYPNIFTEKNRTIEENSKAIYFCLINTFIMDTLEHFWVLNTFKDND